MQSLLFRQRHWLLTATLVVCVTLGGWVWWRFTGPVQVSLAADYGDLPFTVEMRPPQLTVQPGQIVSATFRIRNNDLSPLEAFGAVEVKPWYAKDQVQIFVTQCGGLNAFQHSAADDYLVLFRVAPAGFFGSQNITLQHNFVRANLR
jgi:hypothetical protein